MRTHSEIVRAFGAAALGRALEARGLTFHPSTPQRWADRNSIPGEYWADLAGLGAATLEELAEGARPSAEAA